MIRSEVTVITAAHCAQSGRNRPPPAGQQRPLHHGKRVDEGRGREHDGERLQDGA